MDSFFAWLNKRSQNFPRRSLAPGLVCALIAFLLGQLSIFRGVDEWFFDDCFVWRGARQTTAKVIIVGIDDESLDEIKKPLAYLSPELAEVVTYLKRRQVAAIGLDMIVDESLRDLPDMQPGEAGDAAALGMAIREAGNVVLAEWKVGDRWHRPLPQWRLKSFTDPQPTDLGFVNLSADDDNFLRRQQLYALDGEEERMQFALAVYAVANKVDVAWTPRGLQVGNEIVPLDQRGEMRINFVGPPGSLKTLSFRDVLAAARGKRKLHADLAGAMVLIGMTAHGQQDYHSTSYSNNFARYLGGRPSGLMAGSEVLGNVVATLADRAYIVPLPWYAMPLLLLFFGTVLSAALARMSLIRGTVLIVVHHLFWKAICLGAFTYANMRIEIVPMLLLGVFAFGATFFVRWRRLQHMLGVVKSQAIARALESDPQSLGLRGEERILTALFADIRDFTTFSEGHTPQEVVALLNAYFTAIVPLIEKHGGTLNQYMGDGVMVLFGAPMPAERHAEQAVKTSVAIVRKVQEMQATWAAHDFSQLRIGVGIHTGKVVVGTVGSPDRLDYTAIGDTVNAAARIEAENKKFGTEILLSAETYGSLSRKVRTELGLSEESMETTVKGKQQKLRLYTIDVS